MCCWIGKYITGLFVRTNLALPFRDADTERAGQGNWNSLHLAIMLGHNESMM